RWQPSMPARATSRPPSVQRLRRARDVVGGRGAGRKTRPQPVPETDRLLAQPPAQQDVLAATPRRKVDQALLDILHLAAHRADQLDLVGQRLVESAEQRLRATHVGRTIVALEQLLAAHLHARAL